MWEGALSRLDNDLCSIGLEDVSILTKITDEPITINPDLLRIAQSGAVAVFGLLDWTVNNVDGSVELQIANVGDCSAVLFSVSDASMGELKPQRLVDPHNGSTNEDELRRLVIEHPDDKAEDLIRNGGRLLGELAPTRAFGDVRYKWPADRIHKLNERLIQEDTCSSDLLNAFDALPSPYISPPYLIVKPDVSKFSLKPNDRYLVLATDGLWDTLTPELAASILSRLQPGQCPATRLMRAALSVPIGPDGNLNRKAKEDPRLASALLSLPPGVARLYRDDITLIVIELNAPTSSIASPPLPSMPSTSQNNPVLHSQPSSS
ncbi:unnamed protein product [Rodentolepis nana]|uniref:PPM-type phosphatase domain-containing protein n=1 Tax=Rodentolepis nana TaxID=102285 RepID=A0A0R3TUE4_RODNA|nr:unnamed protein product [Rodentolepis nana]